MRLLLACVLAFLACAGAARADGPLQRTITARDQQRLAGLGEVRAAALAAARAGGSKEDVAALESALAGEALGFGDGYDMGGEWRCRVMKLGRAVPLVVHGWFRCVVADDGSGWRLAKTGGSQRLSGRFYTIDDRQLVYLGALHFAAEAPLPYGRDAQRDQVAVAVRPGRDRVRLEFPLPSFDSMFDILEMRRVGAPAPQRK